MTRTPAEIRSTRIGALARLPAFFALDNKRAVVAGGSPAATWKAELLSAAGARVEVFAAAPSEEMLALAASPPRGAVVGLDHARPITSDLSAEGAQRFAQVVLGSNAVRR